jgi:hypothetical protein
VRFREILGPTRVLTEDIEGYNVDWLGTVRGQVSILSISVSDENFSDKFYNGFMNYVITQYMYLTMVGEVLLFNGTKNSKYSTCMYISRAIFPWKNEFFQEKGFRERL